MFIGMLKNKPEEAFINLLLNETYELLQVQSDFTCNKLSEVMIQQSDLIVSAPIKFMSKISCFRILWKGRLLDIPSNWGIFEEMYKMEVRRDDNFILFGDEGYNCDDLYTVLSHDIGAKLSFFFIKKDGAWVAQGYRAEKHSSVVIKEPMAKVAAV